MKERENYREERERKKKENKFFKYVELLIRK